MTATIAPTIHRADYRPLAWTVSTVELHFALDLAATLVTSRLELVRAPHTPPGPAVLLGDGLTTVSLSVNGKPMELPPGAPGLLELELPGERATLDIVTRVDPTANTALSGIYASRGGLFTQCEAEGFRRITWFPDRPDVMARYTVTLEAERARFPVLLSNGNLEAEGALPGGRHFTRWVDPFPKPSYLFALVAADLLANERKLCLASGREALLQLWVEKKDLDRTGHAMDSLVNAIRWDEERFGLELDLNRFMVVAVSDFNMGAMENKGLNIFNSKLLLARPDTATDVDYESIEAVVGHEYFHNWTGNRVTCRDWFQLTLKEGLTVFRDQEFTADQLAKAGGETARAVKRIDDVETLRAAQFPEDAGPMAHPIRPESYQEINNFYTATVYEKGAEVIRMLATLLGRDGFRKGMDLYFQRHDGHAVTCDDFVSAMADANGRDFSRFLRWYSRAGTPRVTARGQYDAASKHYVLTLEQAPGVEPLVVPVAVGLLSRHGKDLPLQLVGEAEAKGGTRLLEFQETSTRYTFINVPEAPVPSLLRGCSAPVQLEFEEDDATLAFRMAHDGDAFNRWDATQRFMARTVLTMAGGVAEVPRGFLEAYSTLLSDEALDPAYRAQVLGLPSEAWLLERMTPGRPAALREAMVRLTRTLGERFQVQWQALAMRYKVMGAYRYHPADAGKRALANLALKFLCAGGSDVGFALAGQQVRTAGNMTDELAALAALVQSASPQREGALDAFASRHGDDLLVMDKWFSVQATAWRWAPGGEATVARVRRLLTHPAFSAGNPNKVYALLGGFFKANPGEFHAADGSGHALWAEQVAALDRANPQVAARMARAMEHWRSLDPALAPSAKRALEAVAAVPTLSADVREIVGKALGGA